MTFIVEGIVGKITLDDVKYLHLHASSDGNCLFHAVGFLLYRHGLLQGDDDGDFAALRAKVMAWIRKQLSSVSDQSELVSTHILTLDGKDTPDAELARMERINRYLKLMSLDQTWADTLCVHALEEIYLVKIVVYGLPGRTLLNTPSSSVVQHTLRLVCPAALNPAEMLQLNRSCHNHFDPLVLATEEATLPSEVIGKPGRELPRGAWPYWQPGKGLKLYGPPVCHVQYHVSTQLLIAAKAQRSIFSAFSSTVIVDTTKIQARIHLVNNLKSPAICSGAYEANAQDDSFRPGFWLPLERKEQRVVQVVDLSSLQVLFAIKASKKTHACFQVYSRNSGKPLIEARLSKEEVETLKLPKKATMSCLSGTSVSGGGMAQAYASLEAVLLRAAHVFSPEQWKELHWKDSPFQLVVVPADAKAAPDFNTASWTYFQVPSAWDVDIVEAHSGEKVLLLGDSLESLEAVPGVKIEPRTEKTNNAIFLTGEEKTAVGLAMKGLGGKQTQFSENITNAIVERAGGFFAATSWASVIVLKRSKKDGKYYAHSLYYSSTNRALFVLSEEALALAAPLKQASERIQALDKEIVEDRRSEEKSKVASIQQALIEATKKRDKVKEYFEVLVIKQDELRKEQGLAHAQELVQSYDTPIDVVLKELQPLGAEVSRLEHELKEKQKLLDIKEAAIEELVAPKFAERELLMKEIAAARKKLEKQSILREPEATIRGSSDFDYTAEPVPGWHQVVFTPGEIPLTQAVTVGISSCAGGVTFTAEKLPEVIIFWHIDASPTVPVKTIIEQIWSDLDTCPSLRTIASVHPSVWELNKYRKDNLYPEAIQARCETIFMARGKHLYDEGCAVVAGSDYFGVDVTDPSNPVLMFTNDFDKRVMSERRGDRSTTAGLSNTLLDLKEDIFGDYRFDDYPIATTDQLEQYLNRLEGERDVVTKFSDLSEGLETTLYSKLKAGTMFVNKVCADKVKHAKFCCLGGLGVGLFDALKKAPTCLALLDLDAFSVGQKGDQELAHLPVDTHYDWRPGPILPETGKEQEPEPKKPVEKSVLPSTPEAGLIDPEPWRKQPCANCGRESVRGRYSCSPQCKHHRAVLCVSCADGIKSSHCQCGAKIELWDMSHDVPWGT